MTTSPTPSTDKNGGGGSSTGKSLTQHAGGCRSSAAAAAAACTPWCDEGRGGVDGGRLACRHRGGGGGGGRGGDTSASSQAAGVRSSCSGEWPAPTSPNTNTIASSSSRGDRVVSWRRLRQWRDVRVCPLIWESGVCVPPSIQARCAPSGAASRPREQGLLW